MDSELKSRDRELWGLYGGLDFKRAGKWADDRKPWAGTGTRHAGSGAIPSLGTGAGVYEAPRRRFKTWNSYHPDLADWLGGDWVDGMVMKCLRSRAPANGQVPRP